MRPDLIKRSSGKTKSFMPRQYKLLIIKRTRRKKSETFKYVCLEELIALRSERILTE